MAVNSTSQNTNASPYKAGSNDDSLRKAIKTQDLNAIKVEILAEYDQFQAHGDKSGETFAQHLTNVIQDAGQLGDVPQEVKDLAVGYVLNVAQFGHNDTGMMDNSLSRAIVSNASPETIKANVDVMLYA